nr:retrovirus-related Pol polyprotein from transposon TNT 1-94 [Tanacetum cinerariifolium]
MRLVTHGLEGYEFENTCNNDKNLSEIQLEHEKEDELVKVVVKVVHELDCMMVVKEIEDRLLEEMEASHFGKKRSLDGVLSKTLVVRVRMIEIRVDTSIYILNRILIRPILGKTPYKLLRGRKPTLDYFRVFRRKCFILNTKDYLIKFDPKSYEGGFLGYSENGNTYIILNKHTRKVDESLNVKFNETPPPSNTLPLVDDDLDEEEAVKVTEKKNIENDIEDETYEIDKIVNIKESRNHPLKMS